MTITSFSSRPRPLCLAAAALVAGSALALAACKRDPAPAASTTSTTTPASSPAATPGAVDASVAPSRVGAAVKIAAGVRPDLGASLVALPDGRPAVGFVGAKGVAAYVLDAEGTWGELPTRSSAVDAEFTAFDAKAVRASESVIPVAVVDNEVQIALDAVLNGEGKRSHVRCGLGDAPAVVVAESTSAADAGEPAAVDPVLGTIRKCRTVLLGARVVTLLSSVRTKDGALESVLALRTTAPPGDETGAPPVDVILAARAVPGNKAPVQERHVFDPHGVVALEGRGIVALARWGGHVVTVRRDDAFQGDEPPMFTWLDVTAGPPALAAQGRGFAYVVPAMGKLDLFGAAFAADAKLPKPARIAAASLVAPAAAADATSDAGPSDEVSATALVPVGEKLLFAWLSGKAGQRRARGAFVDGTLAPVGPSFELYDGSVAGVRAVARTSTKALVSVLTTKGELLAIDVDGS